MSADTGQRGAYWQALDRAAGAQPFGQSAPLAQPRPRSRFEPDSPDYGADQITNFWTEETEGETKAPQPEPLPTRPGMAIAPPAVAAPAPAPPPPKPQNIQIFAAPIAAQHFSVPLAPETTSSAPIPPQSSPSTPAPRPQIAAAQPVVFQERLSADPAPAPAFDKSTPQIAAPQTIADKDLAPAATQADMALPSPQPIPLIATPHPNPPAPPQTAAAQPGPAATPQLPPLVIEIGRIEIHLTPPARASTTAPARPEPREAAISLNDYLSGHERARR